MIKKLFLPIRCGDYGLVGIRILNGLLIACHGAEIFSRKAMEVDFTIFKTDR